MSERDRRDFLRASIAAVAAGGTLPSLLHLSDTPDTAPRTWGLQLYTVRDEMEKDVAATLRRVASIGYREVEFAGYFGTPPARVRALLRETGLSAPSAHVGLDVVRHSWERALAAAAEIGHKYLVVAYLDERERTESEYQRAADDMNRAAEVARRSGITLAYHNHDFEFRKLPSGTLPYDLLLARLDRSLVALEMDLYWINHGGQNPLPYFATQAGRIHMVHVKDMKADGSMADVGAGRLPFASYFAKSAQAGIRHYFVEHDEPGDAFASVARSLAYLKQLRV